MLSEDIRKKFVSLFNTNPLMVRAPMVVDILGVNLFNDQGNMLVAAIDREIICAISPNYSDICQVQAYNLRDTESIELRKPRKTGKLWLDDIIAVIEEFHMASLDVKGFDCIIGGNIPSKDGISDTVALQCAFAYSFNLLYEHQLSRLELVKLAHAAHVRQGAGPGNVAMQFTCIHNKPNHIISYDSLKHEHEYLPFPMQEYRLALVSTYSQLSEVITTAETLNQAFPKVFTILKKHQKSSLTYRDISIEELGVFEKELDKDAYKMLRFLINENNRIDISADILTRGDIIGFGKNMFKSQDELSLEIGLHNAELEFLTDKIKSDGLADGWRLMTRGTACTGIAIVKMELVDAFKKSLTESFQVEFGKNPVIEIAKIESGTGKI